MRPRRLLRVADLCRVDLLQLLDAAMRIKAAPGSVADSLAHEMLACIFEGPSTRTRLAFAAAAHRLGMLPVAVARTELQLGRGESLADTARSVSAYAAAVVIRSPLQQTIDDFAEGASVPVVNALSDEHHPCEAIAALLTIRERFGGLEKIKLAYIGDGNNVATSLVQAAALAGMQVTLACPAGHKPPASEVATARALAAATGTTVALTDDPVEAATDAHVVYTDTWAAKAEGSDEARLRVFALSRHERPDAAGR